MAKTRDLSTINKKILKEIDKMETEQSIKQLLRDILAIELRNMDRERVHYIAEYKTAFNKYDS